MGIRIYKLAEQLELSNKELIKMLQDLGVDVTSHMSTINEETAELIMDMVLGEEEGTQEDDSKVLKVEGTMTVKELSEEIDVDPSTLMAKLIGLGIMATINQELTSDQLEVVAAEYGYVVEEEEEEEEDNLFGLVNDIEDKQKDLKSRPPVITVMGHVDHGKTTLLDAIRKTEVTASEAGGITQHIGAYQVKVNGQKITFLDTPGHEAFTSMRARGAQATDIAILVVAADDGIMPQTIEAINHAKSAGVPIIVAINKMDRPNAQPDRVKQELMNHGLIPEDWGGDTVCVPVSALKGENLDELLEMIVLTAEMEELKANPTRPANGIIVEAELDRGRGPVATILIKNGTLKVGDAIVAGLASGRVRAMINDQGERVEEAGPATPVEVLGLSDVPNAGDLLEVVEDDQSARDIAQKRQNKRREDELSRNTTVNLEDLFSQIQQGEVKELNIVVKADVQGSVEAVKQSLQKLSTDEVEVKMLHGGVGGITETDVMLAAASNAIIIGFNVRPGVNARKVAEKENVDIRTYRVIYKAIDDVKSAMEGLLDPDYKEVVLGQVEVRQTFKVPKIGTIAGAYVTNGTVNRNAKVRLLRDGTIIHEGEIGSLKRFQDDVKEVAEGYECGIGIEGYNDLKEGDIMEIYDFEEVKRTL
ncbi:translation initiation factor IF-2 [Orenia metallireducens]|jgi:translation initiation factor IF-2|uniref:Translation initiation factor IF-2 n=1 Tax=Orenia metallireducens TaxID=1413210 RepID=A0A285FPR1_9FIRM|nr:translation initiation factor IF-2 [Orenia metallireducens]PRX33625.1 translation initiation factor IF-2 [Orenia metallireducens]SNY12316.1 translation initiation factor IF-2 [Orenia metallireducens]